LRVGRVLTRQGWYPVLHSKDMGLESGSRLGIDVIESSLGAGGMGEVYRARDERLNRTVAIKVLLPARAGDRELRAQFLEEARAASQLNHPNIIPVHDIGCEGRAGLSGDGVCDRAAAGRTDSEGRAAVEGGDRVCAADCFGDERDVPGGDWRFR